VGSPNLCSQLVPLDDSIVALKHQSCCCDAVFKAPRDFTTCESLRHSADHRAGKTERLNLLVAAT